MFRWFRSNPLHPRKRLIFTAEIGGQQRRYDPLRIHHMLWEKSADADHDLAEAMQLANNPDPSVYAGPRRFLAELTREVFDATAEELFDLEALNLFLDFHEWMVKKKLLMPASPGKSTSTEPPS